MKFHIWIIDHELRWLDSVKSDRHIFEIVSAPDIMTALEELEKCQFELVIAGANNLEVLETISQIYSDERVVVTTIQSSTREARDAYHLGPIRYSPKSFTPKDPLNHVNEVISKQNGGLYDEKKASDIGRR